MQYLFHLSLKWTDVFRAHIQNPKGFYRVIKPSVCLFWPLSDSMQVSDHKHGTSDIIPAWTACFLLFVQLKACSPWLKGTDDALALPNRWGCAATWPWETREKQTCVSLASLSMLSLIHCCCIFLQCALGCLISTFITQCPHMQQLFPWLINHLTHIETAKSCIFLVILLLNSHNLSTPTIYCLHSSIHRPHTVRARALCFL